MTTNSNLNKILMILQLLLISIRLLDNVQKRPLNNFKRESANSTFSIFNVQHAFAASELGF